MFTTVAQVKELTGYDVTPELVFMAQGIIETEMGRTEASITSPEDMAIAGRATLFQAAYMKENYRTVFEQVSVAQVTQGGDSSITYKSGDNHSPWVAPLAYRALRHLSWRKSRSVKTGAMFDKPPVLDWSRD